MHFSSLKTTGALLAALAILAGCSTSGTGRGLLSRHTGKATNYIEAMQGGIIANSGVELSRGDAARAVEAEYRALEDAETGRTVTWKGSGASGLIVANAPYQVGTQNCRQYRHSVIVDGKEYEARGVACRNEDGSWTPLN